MKRIPLKKGEEVTSNYNYIIDGVLGSGATCIVYDAHFVDSQGNKKEVKLKECYPHGLSIERIDNNLVWSNEDEKTSAMANFESSYNILSRMQNEDSVKDAAVYTLDMFEANNTRYIATIPTFGESYDKCSNDDIVDIVTTCLALTNAVGKLHNLGYLHMDIKPENFIAFDDHTNKGKNVALFDMDTFISLGEINNGTIKGVSYSEGWAAPEVKSRRFNKLCAATDIFSIGVVLFERIIKRMPYCLDSMSYAEWTFDERFAPGKVSPEAQRLLSEIFHKTLASSIKKRYQSTKDLSDALIDLLDVINKKNYIISSFPANTCIFVGRETEIAELHKGIKDTGKVFISGFGGIGKSEIVKKYINIYGKDYDSISFVRYTGSLLDDLKAIKFKCNVDTQDRMDVLAGLCSERTLIILDNFDVTIDHKDPVFDTLLKLNCSLIVTTRTDFSDIFQDLCFLKLYGLSDAELFQIYENESSNELSEEDKAVLTPLLALGKECTFFWSFFSRLVKVGGYAIKDITQTVLSGIKNLNNSERVLIAKDNLRVKKNIAVAMKELFTLHNLSDRQIEMLCFVRTFYVLILTRKTLAESFNQIDNDKKSSRMEALNELIELGLINEDDSIHIHDVLKDVIDAEFDISCFKIDLIDKFIELEFMEKFETNVNKEDFSSNYQTQSYCSYLCECIISIFNNFNDTYTYEYLTTLIFDMVKIDETTVSVLHRAKSGQIVEFLNKVINSAEIDETVKIKAMMILIVDYSELSIAASEWLIAQEHHDAMKQCEDMLNCLISLINKNSVDTELLDLFYEIEIKGFGRVSDIIGENPIENYIFDFSSFYNDELLDPTDLAYSIDMCQRIANSYEEKLTDDLLTISEAGFKEECDFMYDFRQYVFASNNPSKIKSLADKIHEKLFKNGQTTQYNEGLYREFLSLLVYCDLIAADGNPEKAMENLFNVTAKHISETHPILLTCNDSGIADKDFRFATEHLKKASQEELAFEYEVRYTEKVQERFSRDNIILYDYYKRLSEDSDRISKKDDLPPDEKEKYKKLSLDYQKKADEALGKKY